MAEELQISKYLTIDQLTVYAEVYETVVHRKGRFADAVGALCKADARRDRSSVTKAITALNRKFEQALGMPLLTRTDGEQGEVWDTTPVGVHFFEFAKSTKDNFFQLEGELISYKTEEKPIVVGVRRSTWPLFARIAQLSSERGLPEIEHRQLQNEHFQLAFKGGADIVIDELFLHEKRKILYNELHYYQMHDESIVVLADATAARDLPVEKHSEFDYNFIDAAEIRKLDTFILEQPLYIRMAASVAATLLVGDNYISKENIDIIKRYYPSAIFVPTIDDLPNLLFSKKNGYLILTSSSEANKVDAAVGRSHMKIGILHNSRPLYYTQCVMVERQDKVRPPNEAFSALLKTIESITNKDSAGVVVSAKQKDYSSPWFACAHCNNQLSYKPQDEIDEESYRVACDNCLYVNEYEPETGNVRIYRRASDIIYTKEFYDNEMHCEVCLSTFSPTIKLTTKGREYITCESCSAVYQSTEAKAETVQRKCGSPSCDVKHYFRISGLKRKSEMSCYETLQTIEYDADSDIVKRLGTLNIENIELDNIDHFNKFACPHFGCGAVMNRKLIRNSRKEAFSKCTHCGKDIRIMPKKPGGG